MALPVCCSTVVMVALPLGWKLGGRKSLTAAGQVSTSGAARTRSRLPGRPPPWPRWPGTRPGSKDSFRHVGTSGDHARLLSDVGRGPSEDTPAGIRGAWRVTVTVRCRTQPGDGLGDSRARPRAGAP